MLKDAVAALSKTPFMQLQLLLRRGVHVICLRQISGEGLLKQMGIQLFNEVPHNSLKIFLGRMTEFWIKEY